MLDLFLSGIPLITHGRYVTNWPLSSSMKQKLQLTRPGRDDPYVFTLLTLPLWWFPFTSPSNGLKHQVKLSYKLIVSFLEAALPPKTNLTAQHDSEQHMVQGAMQSKNRNIMIKCEHRSIQTHVILHTSVYVSCSEQNFSLSALITMFIAKQFKMNIPKSITILEPRSNFYIIRYRCCI